MHQIITFDMKNGYFTKHLSTRWFKATFSSPSWGSLEQLKGSLNHPKKGHKELPGLLSCLFSTLVFSHPAFFRPQAKSGTGLDRTLGTFALLPWGLNAQRCLERPTLSPWSSCFWFASALDYWSSNSGCHQFSSIALWKDLLASSLAFSFPKWFNSWPFHPLVGGHLTPLKGSLNHPKKVTKNCQVGFQVSLLLNCKNWGFPRSSRNATKLRMIFWLQHWLWA